MLGLYRLRCFCVVFFMICNSVNLEAINEASSSTHSRSLKLFKREIMRRITTCPEDCTCEVYENDHKIVDCINTEMVDIPQDIPGDVVVLNMSRNMVMTIKSGLLDNLRDLEIVDFSHNKIKEIQRTALEDLNGMRVLDLSYNKIKNISLNDLRQSALNLEVLNISSTEIREVPELYDPSEIYMTKLTHLSMGQNFFTTIPPSHIPTSVKYLDISCLNMKMLKNTGLSGLNQLEELIIRGCPRAKGRIKSVEHKAFATSIRLKHLDLSSNDLTSVPTGLPPSLEVLNLANNKITTIKKTECAKESDMRGRLYVTANNEYDEFGDGRLTRPVGTALSGLDKLRVLTLSGNPIASLCMDEFVNMENLQVLNMSGCSLSSFHPHTFVYPRVLQVLDLSDNNMMHFVTEELSMLEELYLQYNVLENVGKISRRKLPSLDKADFSGNPWRCNCDIKPLLQLLGYHSNEVDFINLHAYSVYYACTFPLKLKGKPLMTLDLDEVVCGEDGSINIWAIAAPASLGLIIILIVIVIVVAFRRDAKKRAKLRAERGIVDDESDKESCSCCCKCCCRKKEGNYTRHVTKDSRRNFDYASDTLVRKNALLNDAAILCNTKDQKWIINKMIPEVHRYREEGFSQSSKKKLNVPPRKLNMNVFTIGQSIKIERLSKCIDSNRKIVLVITHNFVEEEPCILVLNIIRERMVRDPKDSVILLILDAIAWSTMPQCLQFLMVEKTFVQFPQDGRGRQEYYFWDSVCSNMYSNSLRMLLPPVNEETDNLAFEEEDTVGRLPIVNQPLPGFNEDEAPPMRPSGWNTGGRRMEGLSMKNMYMSPERQAKLRRLGLQNDGHLMDQMYGGIEEARNLGREQKKSYEEGQQVRDNLATNFPLHNMDFLRQAQMDDIASVHKDIDDLYSTRGSSALPRPPSSGRTRTILPPNAGDADSIYSEDLEIASQMIRAPERQRSAPRIKPSHLFPAVGVDPSGASHHGNVPGDQLHGTDKTFQEATLPNSMNTLENVNLPEPIPTMDEREEDERSDVEEDSKRKKKKEKKKNKNKSKKKGK
uniref:uncharacterized protein LOC120344455 n=1 Tax=Styela clava TaxID=7725 RepID=UPI00193AACE0|nr:uncharacterized protein LOC120344455 [Styela clava]